VWDLINYLSAGKIVIISTHILEDVSSVCSRTLIIAGGRKVADSTPAELESRSRYHQAINVRFKRPVAAASTLAALAGVQELDESDNGRSYMLFPQPGEFIFPAVSAAIAQHNWPLETLYIERGRLDDVFRRLTEV